MATRMVKSDAGGTAPAFAVRHRHDRAMIAAAVVAIWLAILIGFGLDIVRRSPINALHFALVVHLHVIAYTGWLVLLAVQVWLIRTGRLALHRKTGWLALALIPAMVILGPATAYLGVANNPWMPDKWISWLSVNYTNVVGSAVLLAAGFLVRRNAAAHKRLMIMGTIAVTEPGFSRIWQPVLEAYLGDGYAGFYFATYVGTLLLVLAVGAYDYATRRRLHPAYVAAALWIFANELVADWLYHQQWWLEAMKRATRHTG